MSDLLQIALGSTLPSPGDLLHHSAMRCGIGTAWLEPRSRQLGLGPISPTRLSEPVRKWAALGARGAANAEGGGED